jgi:hypothetical protein
VNRTILPEFLGEQRLAALPGFLLIGQDSEKVQNVENKGFLAKRV